MYVSYVDESGKGGPVLITGGLTAKADPGWTDFSVVWDHVLSQKPRIPYFHLGDRQGLSAREHWNKVDALVEVINAFAERGDRVLIEVEPYKAILRSTIGVTHDNPYLAACVSIFQQCALHLPDPDGTVDFVFDEMGDTDYLELLGAYRRFKETCPNPAVKARLGQEPVRRDDTVVRPLQAADLFTGLMLRACRGDPRSQAAIKRLTIPERVMVWDGPKLRELLGSTAAHTPGVELGLFYEDRKARSKRLKAARKRLKERKN